MLINHAWVADSGHHYRHIQDILSTQTTYMYMYTNDNNVVTYHDEVKLICIVLAYSHFVTYQIAEIISPAVGQPFHI